MVWPSVPCSAKRRDGRAILSSASALSQLRQGEICAGRLDMLRLMTLDVFGAHTHAYEAGQ